VQGLLLVLSGLAWIAAETLGPLYHLLRAVWEARGLVVDGASLVLVRARVLLARAELLIATKTAEAEKELEAINVAASRRGPEDRGGVH